MENKKEIKTTVRGIDYIVQFPENDRSETEGSKATHTPGPWMVKSTGRKDDLESEYIVFSESTKDFVCTSWCPTSVLYALKNPDFKKNDEIVQANIQLIASAPQLAKENQELKAKCNYLQAVIDRRNGEESRRIQAIDTLKRVINLQFALRKIIAQWNEYSESVDEIPNQWFAEACNIAETALEESTKVDHEFEIRKEVKEAEALNAELLEALEIADNILWAYKGDIRKTSGHNLNDEHAKIKSAINKAKLGA